VARYRIDPARSRVWIDARSNVHPIHTETNGLEGWLEFDRADGDAHGHVEFPVSNLKSGNAFEDRELQRRIDSRRYPTISGDLRSIKDGQNGTGHLVNGDLTFRGVTRTYEDQMTIEQIEHAMNGAAAGNTVKLAGQSTFDIRDFGMEPPRILLLKVDPEVTVRVEIVAEEEH
jgi:polyisoprenoid-binding protein YceI